MPGISWIQPDTPLPDLFRACPETRAVFNRYGLRGCGGEHGPAETISFFAKAHGVPLSALLDQLRRTAANPIAQAHARQQLITDVQPRLADAIYRPFFLAALVVVLTVGAAWGVLLLWKIGFAKSFTGLSVLEVNAHGHAQIMGWVGLFIMGFAYQAFPRMWQADLPMPRLALAVWLTTLASIAMRSFAMLFHEATWAGDVHVIGAVTQVLAVSVFAWQIWHAFDRSGLAVSPSIAFIFAALGFMLLQTVFSGWHMARLIAAPDRDALLHQIATWQAPLRDVQVHGMAMLMILGVSMRLFPALFGLPETSRRRGWLAFGLLGSAVLMEVGAFLAYRFTHSHAVAGLLLIPWLMLPIGAAIIVMPWRLWRPLPTPGRDERSGKFIRIAFAWLFVAFAMLLLMPVYQVASGIPFSHAYYGAVRHAITVGFVSMMIVGMAAKIVPTLRGIDRDALPALWLPFALINLGCLLRVSFQIGTDWQPAFFQPIAISGALEWTGLAIWAGHLACVMLGLGRYHQATSNTWGPRPERIEAEHRVAAVLHWHPELEDVFVSHGFEQIRCPVLRQTVARQVSLAQACRMKQKPVEAFIKALNEGRRNSPASSTTHRCDSDNSPTATKPIAMTINGNAGLSRAGR